MRTEENLGNFTRGLVFKPFGWEIRFEGGITVSKIAKPSSPPKFAPPKQTAAVTVKNPMGDYELFIAGKKFVVRSYHGLRVEIDPYNRIVQADGHMIWVESNFDGKSYGFEPDHNSFHGNEEKALEVDWKAKWGEKNRHGDLYVTILRESWPPLLVAIHIASGKISSESEKKLQYVRVWDAAIKARHNNRYVLLGPQHPLPAFFQELLIKKPPDTVHRSDLEDNHPTSIH